MRYFYNALILLLAVIGVSMVQFSAPNQEIVVQFANDEVTTVEALDAVAVVKKQLEAIGIQNIQVQRLKDGNLKITYYSDIDVSSIKKILSKNSRPSYGFTTFSVDSKNHQLPCEDESSNFELDIYVIQKATDFDTQSKGYLSDSDYKNIRFYKPIVSFNKAQAEEYQIQPDRKVNYFNNRNNSFNINDANYCIPEVRAGPLT